MKLSMNKSSHSARNFSLDSFDSAHFFEELSSDDSFFVKKFFRGLSIYFCGRAVAYLSNRPGDRSFRGKDYRIEIWNGCLIPTHRERHAELLRSIKGSVIHPVIEKWIYLPQNSEHFEDSMVQLVNMIKNKGLLIGIEADLKPKKARSTKPNLSPKKNLIKGSKL
jgi:hypothetical protein